MAAPNTRNWQANEIPDFVGRRYLLTVSGDVEVTATNRVPKLTSHVPQGIESRNPVARPHDRFQRRPRRPNRLLQKRALQETDFWKQIQRSQYPIRRKNHPAHQALATPRALRLLQRGRSEGSVARGQQAAPVALAMLRSKTVEVPQKKARNLPRGRRSLTSRIEPLTRLAPHVVRRSPPSPARGEGKSSTRGASF